MGHRFVFPIVTHVTFDALCEGDAYDVDLAFMCWSQAPDYDPGCFVLGHLPCTCGLIPHGTGIFGSRVDYSSYKKIVS